MNYMYTSYDNIR